MQTFLPYPNFTTSASVLDYKRLGKQRVETLQIMQALLQVRLQNTYWIEHTGRYSKTRFDKAGNPLEILRKHDNPMHLWEFSHEKVGWDTHAVTKMWRGHERYLLKYQLAICNDWKDRGYKETCFNKTAVLWDYAGRPGELRQPPWLGDVNLHASHRSNLLRKDFDHYKMFGWTEPTNLEYSWPR